MKYKPSNNICKRLNYKNNVANVLKILHLYFNTFILKAIVKMRIAQDISDLLSLIYKNRVKDLYPLRKIKS